MPTLLKPISADLRYHGNFTDTAFELLAYPVPLYRSLLRHLAVHGLTTAQLKYEGASVADTAVTCSLLAYSAWINVRLTNLEVQFLRLRDLDLKRASDILLGAHAAFQEVKGNLEIKEHVVFFSSITELGALDYPSAIRRYVLFPPELSAASGAVGFYLPADESTGQRGEVILDAVGSNRSQLALRVNMTFDSGKVSAVDLPRRIQEFIASRLGILGLALEGVGEA